MFIIDAYLKLLIIFLSPFSNLFLKLLLFQFYYGFTSKIYYRYKGV